ncbi:hypothetical protein HYV91_01835 [Candidatus Wolfebacteria bacterium]|nr:hypothetical protein [Candidatus Wolfebacteria bacterium]
MYNFILQFSLMVSLGVMIYLMARALPRVGDEIVQSEQSKIDQWFSALPLDKIDSAFGNFAEKFLRRFRLILMKLDNLVGGYLHRVKKFNGNGGGNGPQKPSLFTNGSAGGEEKREEDAI